VKTVTSEGKSQPAPPVYLDHQATTPVDARVVEAMLPYFTEKFGNAASRAHAYGWTAKAAVDRAREEVAAFVGARSAAEIVFTSGATESNNLALLGVMDRYAEAVRTGQWSVAAKGGAPHIVVSAIEHPSVLDVCAELERRGCAVTRVPVGSDGVVRVEEVEAALSDATVLVSVMLANNEVGTIQPIERIGALTRARGVLFHSDAVQGVGRVPFDVERMCVDLASITAHKLYGPKGCGALYVRRSSPRVRLAPQLFGGGHERGLRSGTLNVPGIVGFAKACELMLAEREAETVRLAALRDRLESGIVKRLRSDGEGPVVVNGAGAPRLPGATSLSFVGLDAGALMAALSRVAVSSGSACSSESPEPSHVLSAMGASKEHARGTIRFGLGRGTTAEEVEAVIADVVATVRRARI
jgi:cysteine desulfurase